MKVSLQHVVKINRMRDFVLRLVLNLWKSVCKLWHISVQTNHISSFHLPVWSVATVLGSTALGFIMFIFCLIHDYKYYLKIEHVTYVYAIRTSAQSTATSPLPSVDPSAAFTSKHFINPRYIINLVLNKITVLTKLTSKEKVFCLPTDSLFSALSLSSCRYMFPCDGAFPPLELPLPLLGVHVCGQQMSSALVCLKEASFHLQFCMIDF